jgi:hypothetical protein
MKLLPVLALLGLATLPLAGCVSLGTVVTQAETVYQQVKNYYTDAPKAVYALKGGFIIVQSAVAKFKATECPAIDSQPWCASVIPQVRVYNKAAEDAIATAKAFVLANPKADASTFYQAAVTATEAYAQFATTIGVQTP